MRRLPLKKTVIFLLAFFILPAAVCFAQLGFTAYTGGTLPTGEFSRTDIERDPPKSGAEKGHSFGGGIAWRFRLGSGSDTQAGFYPLFVATLEYSESGFGNDVPVSVFDELSIPDQVQYATPESHIRMRGARFGLRIIPWGYRGFSPTFGGGLQRGKIKVASWAFYGPGPQATELFEPQPLQITLESGNILGGFIHTGFITQSKHSPIIFADIVYHFLFSEGVSTTVEVLPNEDPPIEDEMKSDIQWWEIRGGLMFFFGD